LYEQLTCHRSENPCAPTSQSILFCPETSIEVAQDDQYVQHEPTLSLQYPDKPSHFPGTVHHSNYCWSRGVGSEIPFSSYDVGEYDYDFIGFEGQQAELWFQGLFL